jgi:uncharacterized protein YdeI (YjbR/CyaY-like superfamily)
MKKSTDPRIDAYIAKSAEFARPILKHLRALVHQGCPEAEEAMKWSMPFFMHHGILCHMAAFKAHCSFGFRHQVMETILNRELGKGADGMGHFGRITGLSDLPSDRVMLGYIRQAAKLMESGQPALRPRKAKPKSADVVPPALVAALKKNRAAAATFEKFSPSHRREYIEWINEAKRDETRDKRLATTLEWLATGKPRNWKYMNC